MASNTPTKAVLVTGGSVNGIDHATAVAFAKLGYQVAITGGGQDRLQQALKDMEAAAVAAPASTRPEEQFLVIETNFEDGKQASVAVPQVVDKFGRLDILVNNTSHSGHHKSLLEEGRYSLASSKRAPLIKSTRRDLAFKYPPFFITFVSIFQLVSFVYYALRSDEPLTLTGPVPYQSKLIYNPQRRYEIWRYLTYMFIHAGYWHISFNVLVQLAVGVPLEVVHNFRPVLIIYLGGVMGGALGNSLADPHSFLAGASSGCYALIAAHISNLIINWTEIRGACCRLFTLLLFTTCDLGTAIYERHAQVSLRTYKTSYGGHLAGALSGLLLGLVFLRNVRPLNWEREVKKWAAGVYFTLAVFAIFFSLTNPDYFPQPDRRDLVWTASPFGFQREQ